MKQRLPDVIRYHRSKLESVTAFADRKTTFGAVRKSSLDRSASWLLLSAQRRVNHE